MLLGALSVVQVVFLPGYLALRLSRTGTGSLLETGIVVFSLSLLLNYLCVFALTLLGAYTRTAVFVLIIVEAVVALALLVVSRSHPSSLDLELQLPARQQPRKLAGYVTVIAAAALFLSALAALVAAFRFNVFDAWDAIFSWNQWAYAWYSGSVPQHVALYPQLIPANWSMMYLIAGNPELQLFPLSIMPLFGVGILAMFFDVGIRRRRLEYLVGLLLCIVAVWGLQGVLFAKNANAFGGYVDIPVTFMATAALYLLELRNDRRPADWRELALPLVIACAAAVTKANGAYALAVVLLLAILGHVANRVRLSAADWLKSGALALCSLALVPGTWYALKFLDFAAGRDAVNAAGLTQAVEAAAGDLGLATRLLHSVSLLPGSWVTLAALVSVVVLSVKVPRARWVALGVLAPYSLLWAGFLSYDIRNWLPMVPLVAYLAALGFGGLAERRWHADMRLVVSGESRRLPRPAVAVAASIGSICLAVAAALLPTPELVEIELDRQRRIGNPDLNAKVYAALARDPSIAGDLLTDYAYLGFLPELRSDPWRLQNTSRVRVSHLYHKTIETSDLEGRDCLLLCDLVPPEVNQLVEQRIEDGTYWVVFDYRSKPFMAYSDPVSIRLIRVGR